MSTKIEGYNKVRPIIKKISFKQRGKFTIHLKDGRTITSPIANFPSIKKLTPKERNQIQIIGTDGFTFKACDEVFHLEQILGDYGLYRYKN